MTHEEKSSRGRGKAGKIWHKAEGALCERFLPFFGFFLAPRMVMKALSLKYRESVGRSGENSQNRTKRNAFPKQENEEEKRQLFPET